MKRVFALILAAMMLLSLAACSQGAKLTTFEMEVLPTGVEEPAKAAFGYPGNFKLEEKEFWVELVDEKLDVLIEVFLVNDYDCYEINREYAQEEYFFYEDGKYGDFNGYACMTDEASSDIEVFVYLGCVEEMDDVYMTFRISSASRDLDADAKKLYQLKQVQEILNSVVYTAPAK